MDESRRNMARQISDSLPSSKPSLRTGSSAPTGPDFSFEDALLDADARFVAGIDEVGRGPLAGPVVAAAVILDPARIPQGLNDSKKLKTAERERLFVEILASGSVSVASASAAEIDRVNIRQATFLAMRRALAGLPALPSHVLIDGRDVPACLNVPATAIVEGDARSLSIAAASIVAKVMRDRMMTRLCTAFPAYGFSRHMGYGVPAHLRALNEHGPCLYHRRSFRPIRPADPTSR